MNEELNNIIDDILKEKLKLHYENEELEAQGKLIKELCKEIERLKEENKKYNKWIESLNKDNHRLNNIIKEVREYIEGKYDYLLCDDTFLDHDERIDSKQIKHILEILDKENK